MKQNASPALSGPDFELNLSELVSEDDHYLKRELYQLVGKSPAIFEFLKTGCLDGIWYWDLTDLGQEWLSPRFKSFFGFEDHEMANTPEWWQANIHPDDLTTALENFERHKTDPSHPYDQIVRYRHRNGSTVWVRCRGLILRNKDGEPVRMIGAHSDVTALKQAELELQLANESLNQFASVASHDLQAPLRQIGMFAGMLREDSGDVLDEDSREYLDRIESGVERMRGLIRSFLEFARSESASLDRTSFSLRRIIAKAQQTLFQQTEDIEVKLDCQDGDAVVLGDETLLTQVMINLFENAIKYRSEASPEIAVTWRRRGTLYDVSVTDIGIGIDPKFEHRIFELFTRIDATNEPGSGIGLAHCRRVINRHGGEIRLDTTFEGPGSRFVFSVPAA
jgi:PAS domain S-box-containing protein